MVRSKRSVARAFRGKAVKQLATKAARKSAPALPSRSWTDSDTDTELPPIETEFADESEDDTEEEGETNEHDLRSRQPYREELIGALGSVKLPGSFAATGTLSSFSFPRFDFPGGGLVKMPLLAHEGVALRKAVSSSGPVANGEEALGNTPLCRCLHLTPDGFEISNPLWETQLLSLVNGGVKQELGVANDVDVELELLGLSLTEDGCPLTPHHLTHKKRDGMFAYLAILLPSAHTGGGIVVRHAGTEIRLNADDSGLDSATYIAFIDGCAHETTPPQQGFLLQLTYSLTAKATSEIPPPVDNSSAIQKCVEAITAWDKDPEGPLKLVLVLKGKYSSYGPCMDSLKGWDRAAVDAIQRAARVRYCFGILGILKSCVRIADSEDEEQYEMDSEDEEQKSPQLELQDVSYPQGQSGALRRLPVDCKELLEVHDVRRMACDHHAALVLWLPRKHWSVLAQSSLGAFIKEAGPLAIPSGRVLALAEREDLVVALTELCSSTMIDSGDFGQLAAIVARFGTSKMAQAIVKRVPLEVAVECIGFQPFELPLLQALDAACTPAGLVSCLDLLVWLGTAAGLPAVTDAPAAARAPAIIHSSAVTHSPAVAGESRPQTVGACRRMAVRVAAKICPRGTSQPQGQGHGEGATEPPAFAFQGWRTLTAYVRVLECFGEGLWGAATSRLLANTVAESMVMGSKLLSRLLEVEQKRGSLVTAPNLSSEERYLAEQLADALTTRVMSVDAYSLRERRQARDGPRYDYDGCAALVSTAVLGALHRLGKDDSLNRYVDHLFGEPCTDDLGGQLTRVLKRLRAMFGAPLGECVQHSPWLLRYRDHFGRVLKEMAGAEPPCKCRLCRQLADLCAEPDKTRSKFKVEYNFTMAHVEMVLQRSPMPVYIIPRSTATRKHEKPSVYAVQSFTCEKDGSRNTSAPGKQGVSAELERKHTRLMEKLQQNLDVMFVEPPQEEDVLDKTSGSDSEEGGHGVKRDTRPITSDLHMEKRARVVIDLADD